MEIYINITKSKLSTFTLLSVIIAFVTVVNGCSKVRIEERIVAEIDNCEDECEYEYERELGKQIFANTRYCIIRQNFQHLNTYCPSDYYFHFGDKVGSLSVITTDTAKSIDECGLSCNNNQNCKSIKRSDIGKSRQLLTPETTDGPTYEDIRFCLKVQDRQCVSRDE